MLGFSITNWKPPYNPYIAIYNLYAYIYITCFFPQLGLKSIQAASLNFRSIKVSSITFSQQQWMFHPKGDAKDLGNQFGNIKTTGRDGKIWEYDGILQYTLW
jgi:hypothetical protein